MPRHSSAPLLIISSDCPWGVHVGRGESSHGMAAMRIALVSAVLLAAIAAADGLTAIGGPPRGPWRGSRGVRESGLRQGKPLLHSCKELWRPTRLDHFSEANPETFEQRYFLCDEHWKPGGSIFFYLGNEADVTLYLNNTGLMWELAPRYNALMVFAEHRYYGQSKPFSPKKLRKRMHWLTSEQAMADYATLIWELKEQLGDWDVPVIGFGGSYGGMLATWFRIKYPHLLDGAIAGSAPIWTYEGERPPFDPGSFAKIVTRDASPEGGSAPACADNVRRAWAALLELGETAEGRRSIEEAVGLCSDSSLEDADDVLALREWAASAWDYLAMGNYPYPSSYIVNGALPPLPAFPVRVACSHLANASLADDPPALLGALGRAIGVFYNHTEDLECFSFKEGPNPETDEDADFWGYQYCTEQFQLFSKDGRNDMFWPEKFNKKLVVEGCRQTWGVTPRPLWATIQWGGKRLESASNIVFSNGLLDPWSGGGVLSNITGAKDLVAVVIPEGAHHLDLMFSHPDDPPSLKEARALEEHFIAKWIREVRDRPQPEERKQSGGLRREEQAGGGLGRAGLRGGALVAQA